MTKSKYPKSLGIRHIALRVRDMGAMLRFYKEVLGYKVEWEPDPDNVYLTSGLDNLALHFTPHRIESGSLDHFGILVRTAKGVDAWAEHVRKFGVKLDKEPKTHRDGARSFYVSDPEGNVIQFIHHPPISRKG